MVAGPLIARIGWHMAGGTYQQNEARPFLSPPSLPGNQPDRCTAAPLCAETFSLPSSGGAHAGAQGRPDQARPRIHQAWAGDGRPARPVLRGGDGGPAGAGRLTRGARALIASFFSLPSLIAAAARSRRLPPYSINRPISSRSRVPLRSRSATTFRPSPRRRRSASSVSRPAARGGTSTASSPTSPSPPRASGRFSGGLSAARTGARTLR